MISVTAASVGLSRGEGFIVAHIKLGPINTANPWLWANTEKFGEEYLIADKESQKEPWYDVNQFCSITAVKWLLANGGPDRYGLNSLKDADKIQAAEDLISHDSLDAQVNYATEKLNGVNTADVKEVAENIKKDKYPAATKLWAGSNKHAVAFYVSGKDKFRFYDPDDGTAINSTSGSFDGYVETFQINVFVVAERS